MQQLTEALMNEINSFHGDDGGLREAATKWSAYCIGNLDGQLLKEGLNVSAAITQFCNELMDVREPTGHVLVDLSDRDEMAELVRRIQASSEQSGSDDIDLLKARMLGVEGDEEEGEVTVANVSVE